MKQSIVQAMEDDAIFGKWFAPKKRWFGKTRDSWAAWKIFLSAIFALPLTPEQMEIYKRHTGRNDLSAAGFREVYAIVGRRGGKSLIAALIAVYIACFIDHGAVLAPGESAVCMIIANDKRQGRIILGYVVAFLTQIPILKKLVKAVLKESVELTNGITIEIHAPDYRGVRGFSALCVIGDEASFWDSGSNSANPAAEILNAVRPSMATTGGLLLLISSAYGRNGVMYDAHQTYFGQEAAQVMVWRATSLQMNPTIDRDFVARAFARDPVSARNEFDSEFRSDQESFVSREAVEACIVRGRFELAYAKGKDYHAFTDPSGGRSDSFTLAIAHAEGNITVLDVLAERPAPFSPEESVAVFADILKRYHIGEVMGDRYAGAWPEEAFARHGITYRQSEKDRSSLYIDLLPQIMSGSTQLLDDARIVQQLCGLERRTGRGKDIIDHGPGQHDDCGNVIAGVLGLVAGGTMVYGMLEVARRIQSGLADFVWPTPTNDPENPRNLNLRKTQRFEIERNMRGIDTAPPNKTTWNLPATPPCTRCGSALTSHLSGFVRCAQCAYQDESTAPPSMYANRDGDIIARRRV